MVSRKDANELGREHNSKRPKSSSSYLTSIDNRSATISLETDMWLNTEPPSSILSVNNFILLVSTRVLQQFLLADILAVYH
jgi:hypothetical protein